MAHRRLRALRAGRYVEEAAGGSAYDEEIKDMSVGALAYDAVPLSGVGKLDPFSPEFQSLTTNKVQ